MDFSWSSEELEFKEKVIHFVTQELSEDVLERDKKSEFSFKNWQKCADFGFQGLAAPSQYGGASEAVNILRSTLAMESLGYACSDNGLALALSAQMWTVQLPILQFGNEEQKHKFLPKLVSGKIIGCHALTEATAGSDVFNMQTTAKKVDGGYILSGEKRLITLAPIADISLVFAKTNPKLGKWGISCFILEKGMSGFSAGPMQEKMGMRTVPLGTLEFSDCFVPESNLLGSEGAGWTIAVHSLEYDRCGILAGQLGAMERQLEETLDYVKSREQFGQPIGKFQSVANRVADMKLRLETSRLLLYKVAWLKNNDKSAIMESALLKLHLSENFLISSLDSLRNHGGIGYLSENDVERNLRDSLGGIIYAGTSDIQRNIIAELLGL